MTAGSDGSDGLDSDDFSAVPVSIGELRADKSQRSSDWSPREARVSMLRDIDSGKSKPDALVIVWRDFDDEGRPCSHFVAASPDPHVTIGMLESAKLKAWGL